MTEQPLHLQRRARVRTAAVDYGLDALILGRSDDVLYTTGAAQLWTAGTRPFGAVATFIIESAELYLMSTWDEGVPADIPFEHLHGISWNPRTIVDRLAAIEGLAGAARIGVDALSPGFARLLRAIAPDAEIVAADDALYQARRIKLPAELDLIREAGRDAADIMNAIVESVAADRPGGEVAAVGVTAGAVHGRVQPAGEFTVRATSTKHLERPVGAPSDPLPAGGLVRVDTSLLVDGYEGGFARTISVDFAGPTLTRLQDEALATQRAIIDQCRPGCTGAQLAEAAAGVEWHVHGVGLGYERPVIDPSTGHDVVLEADMVLSVEADTFEPGLGTVARRDVVVVGHEPEVLTPEGV